MGQGLKVAPIAFVAALALTASSAFAHEAYVLTPTHFDQGLTSFTQDPLAPLFQPGNLEILTYVGLFTVLSFFVVLVIAATKFSARIDGLIKKAKEYGPFIVRIAIGVSFLYAAQSNVFLGPEVPIDGIVGGEIIRFMLFLLGTMFIGGIFTEFAAVAGMGIFLYMAAHYGLYFMTYANYFGEFLVLILFGSRFLSFDKIFFGDGTFLSKLWKKRDYETPILRIFFGVALIYAGITVKFLHQSLTVDVFNQYHGFLYIPLDPSFVAAVGGLAEVTVGLCILLGFAMRWNLILSLTFITMTLLYFRELLWPHLILYGISISLLINSGDRLSLDRRIVPTIGKLFSRFAPGIFTDRRRR